MAAVYLLRTAIIDAIDSKLDNAIRYLHATYGNSQCHVGYVDTYTHV